MLELEQLEFRRMLVVSIALHLAAFGATLATTSFTVRRYLDFSSPGPMNVMWARTLQAPEATAPNKLPGPVVALPEEEAKPGQRFSLDEAARKKAMAEAVASVRRDIDDRPIPRPDNYPSKGAPEKGLPGGPGGLSGLLGGNPAFTGYKAQIQRILLGNFIWIRPQTNLKAEILINIDEEGNILSPVISKSSGDAAFDSAAMRAVKKSSPLPPPPAEIAQDLIKEGFGFMFDPGKK